MLYRDGVETAIEAHTDKRGGGREMELGFEVVYGVTTDWSVGFQAPYTRVTEAGQTEQGIGDVALFTKYRLWRNDTLGAQEAVSALLKVKSGNADDRTTPALGTGTSDTIGGLAYGYEGRKWYRWASVRYRRNGENEAGLRRGDRVFVDLVGGVRPHLGGYYEPDTVWMLELNGEFGRRAKLSGVELADTGGAEWFVAPGIFWTKRNFAIKAGIQFPISSDLNGSQEQLDYRAKFLLEWHL